MDRKFLLILLSLLAISSPAQAKVVTLPVDIGVGPAAYWVSGAIANDQLAHFGIKLNIYAIISHALIAANINRVPAQYRKMALGIDEVEYQPSIFIPDSLIISPRYANTGIYGATWRPIALTLLKVKRQTWVDLGVGVLLTYAFIHSDKLSSSPIHFLRPGLDLQFEWTIPVIQDAFAIGLGAATQWYIPQKIDGPFFEMGGVNDASIYQMSQVFLKFHWRIPYDANL